MNRKHIVPAFGALCVLTLFGSFTHAQTRSKKKGLTLPPAVAETLKRECPECVISRATKEKENGVTIYDFEFKKGQGEMDVAADGSVIDRETPANMDDVPAAAMEAIRKAGAAGKIKYVAKDEIRAELRNGKVIKLDSPKYAYEADLEKGSQAGEVVVTPEGQITEGPKWRRKGAKD